MQRTVLTLAILKVILTIKDFYHIQCQIQQPILTATNHTGHMHIPGGIYSY